MGLKALMQMKGLGSMGLKALNASGSNLKSPDDPSEHICMLLQFASMHYTACKLLDPDIAGGARCKMGGGNRRFG